MPFWHWCSVVSLLGSSYNNNNQKKKKLFFNLYLLSTSLQLFSSLLCSFFPSAGRDSVKFEEIEQTTVFTCLPPPPTSKTATGKTDFFCFPLSVVVLGISFLNLLLLLGENLFVQFWWQIFFFLPFIVHTITLLYYIVQKIPFSVVVLGIFFLNLLLLPGENFLCSFVG